jgi:hypothetical protein
MTLATWECVKAMLSRGMHGSLLSDCVAPLSLCFYACALGLVSQFARRELILFVPTTQVFSRKYKRAPTKRVACPAAPRLLGLSPLPCQMNTILAQGIQQSGAICF